ncbi:dihydrodipicolinate reductase [Candidatus Sumerlaeota bacterium]|nr:dihydrodipicolinate reductase [Candidatus Sumerlaeota bacterium]
MALKKIRAVQFGLGPIGIECMKWILKKPGYKLVGAIDIDPAKIGKSLDTIMGEKTKTGIVVSDDPKAVFAKTKPDIVLHTTQSSLKKVFPQLELIIKAGINVVSSTEELLLPDLQNPTLAKKIDLLAKKHGVSVLGTGVNPGFVMDTLPLCLSSMCLEIQSISVRRELDAGKRRLPLQKKVGSCLSAAEFQALKKQNKIGHVGLRESLELILKGLGWKADKVVETLDPVVADRKLTTEYFTIDKGRVCGIKHVIRALKSKKQVVTLDLRMYVGAPESFDLVEIDGTPPIKCRFTGGIQGDKATVAALVNSAPRVVSAAPGLLTMKDLKLPLGFDPRIVS